MGVQLVGGVDGVGMESSKRKESCFGQRSSRSKGPTPVRRPVKPYLPLVLPRALPGPH